MGIFCEFLVLEILSIKVSMIGCSWIYSKDKPEAYEWKAFTCFSVGSLLMTTEFYNSLYACTVAF